LGSHRTWAVRKNNGQHPEMQVYFEISFRGFQWLHSPIQDRIWHQTSYRS